MKDVAINFGGYRLKVTEMLTMKTWESREAVAKRVGEPEFVVMLSAKPLPVEGRRAAKAEGGAVNPDDGVTGGAHRSRAVGTGVRTRLGSGEDAFLEAKECAAVRDVRRGLASVVRRAGC